MSEQENENGISLGEIFKVIFRRKWILLGVSVVCALLMGIFSFVANKSDKVYQIKLKIDSPAIEGSLYPDGTSFTYKDLVSYDNLQSVKESNEKFADINIDTLFYQDGITVKTEYRSMRDETAEDQPTGYYIFTTNSKYFKSYSVTVDYVKSVAESAVSYIEKSTLSLDHSVNLALYANAETYSEKISYLEAQKNYLRNGYNKFVQLYGEQYAVNGKTLASYIGELESSFSAYNIDNLKQELENKYYALEEEKQVYKQMSEIWLKDLTDEKADNASKIESLSAYLMELLQASSAQNIELDSLNEQIVALTVRQVDIEREMTEINNKLNALDTQDTAEFDAKLAKHYSALDAQTEIFGDVYVKTNSEKSRVVYDTNSLQNISENKNVVLYAIVGLIGGFVVAAIVILIVDLPKYIKNRKTEEQEA